MSDAPVSRADRLVQAATKAAEPVYEATMCTLAGCCGDFEGAVKASVVAVLRELAASAKARGEADQRRSRSAADDGLRAMYAATSAAAFDEATRLTRLADTLEEK
jgi:hypothetical protein